MFAALSTLWLIGIFAAAGVVVVIVSIRMTGIADQIADRAGWGESVVGGVLLGGATSLSGAVVSMTAAWDGDASLAFSNGVGGIAAQTAFLAIADMWHRRANLEHAGAEVTSLFQGVLLLLLLTYPILAWSAPPVSFWQVHPVSVALVATYVTGVWVTKQVRDQPMWRAVETRETREDTPEDEEDARRSPVRPLLIFVGLAALLAIAGWAISQSAQVFVTRFGLSSTLVGALMTAVVTSTPELVTTVAAVRRGALQLAIGGIIGGNTFDTLFLSASDLFYREGSLYHELQRSDFFWLAVGLTMTSVLVAGLISRQQRGPGGIGVESALLLVLYAGAVALQSFTG